MKKGKELGSLFFFYAQTNEHTNTHFDYEPRFVGTRNTSVCICS